MMIHKELLQTVTDGKLSLLLGLENKLLHVMLNVGIDNEFGMLKAAASMY